MARLRTSSSKSLTGIDGRLSAERTGDNHITLGPLTHCQGREEGARFKGPFQRIDPIKYPAISSATIFKSLDMYI